MKATFNKSNIMKSAWSMFKAGKSYSKHIYTFAECLKIVLRARNPIETYSVGDLGTSASPYFWKSMVDQHLDIDQANDLNYPHLKPPA